MNSESLKVKNMFAKFLERNFIHNIRSLCFLPAQEGKGEFSKNKKDTIFKRKIKKREETNARWSKLT